MSPEPLRAFCCYALALFGIALALVLLGGGR